MQCLACMEQQPKRGWSAVQWHSGMPFMLLPEGAKNCCCTCSQERQYDTSRLKSSVSDDDEPQSASATSSSQPGTSAASSSQSSSTSAASSPQLSSPLSSQPSLQPSSRWPRRSSSASSSKLSSGASSQQPSSAIGSSQLSLKFGCVLGEHVVEHARDDEFKRAFEDLRFRPISFFGRTGHTRLCWTRFGMDMVCPSTLRAKMT